jgi:hypothetical protein
MRRKKPRRFEQRFTVTLTKGVYGKINRIRRKSRDWIPLTRVINLAVHELLDGKKDARLVLRLAEYAKKRKI